MALKALIETNKFPKDQYEISFIENLVEENKYGSYPKQFDYAIGLERDSEGRDWYYLYKLVPTHYLN